MKKLFTSLALLATVFCASAADVIDAVGLHADNPSAIITEWNGDNYDDAFKFNPSLTCEASSGVTYELSEVALTEDFFRFKYNYDLSSNIRGYNAEKWVKNITVEGISGEYLTVYLYGDTEKFDYTSWDERNGASYQYQEYSVHPNEDNEFVFNINVPIHFFVLSLPQGNIDNIKITWTDEKPVPTVETPVISTYANPVQVGSSVSVKTATKNATIHASVYVNDVLFETQPKPWVQEEEYLSMSITLPGKAGDKVTVEAYATKEDWADSETATWTCDELAMSPAPRPTITKVGSDMPWISYLMIGEQLEIQVNTTDVEGNEVPLEGAKVTYTYGWSDWDNPDNDFTSESITADAPVIVTVPDNAVIGANFVINATAIAEGYRESSEANSYIQIISNVLESPTFSLEDGAAVKAGGSLNINRPTNATEIHYTVNNGEEQICEDWSATIPVEEEITVTAWATGEAPFEPSEKVTVTVAPEKFEDWMDVLNYNTFGLTNDDQDSSFKVYDSKLVNETTGVNYKYEGGFYQSWVDTDYVNCFYMSSNSWNVSPYLRNVNPAASKDGNLAPLSCIQIDPCNDKAFYVFLSDEPIEEITNDMTNYSYDENAPLRFTVACDYSYPGSDYPDRVDMLGKMINLDDLQDEIGTDERVYNDKLYFAIVPLQATQSNYLERAIVGYKSDILTGVESVNAADLTGVEAIYNLNGVKVEAKNLVPGIYVRIADGKTSKVIVK